MADIKGLAKDAEKTLDNHDMIWDVKTVENIRNSLKNEKQHQQLIAEDKQASNSKTKQQDMGIDFER